VYRGQFETIDPERYGQLQARVDLPRGVELDVMATFVGQLPQINPLIPGTPGYSEMTVRAGWRLNSRVEVAVIGRDILHDRHAEFISPTSSRITYLERAIFSRISVAF
jgi:iron complex outermembrane receptor protein